MMEWLAIGLVVLISVGATIAIVLAVWHLVMMYRGLPRRWLTSALGPLVLAVPGLFSESTVVHRNRFLIYAGIAIALVSTLIAIDWLARGGQV